jgi:hypothetical protein
MDKNKKEHFLFGFKISNIFSFNSNIIKDYFYNRFFYFKIFKMINFTHFNSIYKLFIFSNQISQVLKIVYGENNNLKKKIKLFEKIKIKKNSMIKFSNYFQDWIFSGIIENNLLMNFFFELEFTWEKKNKFYFSDQSFSLLFYIMFTNICLLKDQTVIEHSFTFTKSFGDFRIDFNGLNKFHQILSDSNYFFIDNFSYLYENNVLQALQKNINYLFNKKTKIYNFRKNFKQTIHFHIFKIKIKIKKYPKLLLNLGSSNVTKNIVIENLYPKKFFNFKINQFITFYLINIFINNFKTDIDYLIIKIVELFWFHFSIKKTHIISHLISKCFLSLQMYLKNKKKAKFFFVNPNLLIDNCNSLFCYKIWINTILSNIININTIIRDFILEWLYLFGKNLNVEFAITNLISINMNNNQSNFLLEMFEKDIKFNCFRFFRKLKFLKLLYLKKNHVEFRKKTYFFEVLFKIINMKKNYLFSEIEYFFKKKKIFEPEKYLFCILLSIFLSNRSFNRKKYMIQRYQSIVQCIITTKAAQFYCLKSFFLIKLYNDQINYLILSEKIDFFYELDINNLPRFIIIQQTISISEFINFFQKYKFFFKLLNKNKITIKNDKKKISKLFKKFHFKKRIIFLSYNKLKQIEKVLKYKKYETECSLLEFALLFLNIFFKNIISFSYSLIDNVEMYKKWTKNFFFRKIFKKKLNEYKIKLQKKNITNKTKFLNIKKFFL